MPVDTIPSAEACNCFAVRAAARHVTQSYDQFLAPTGLRTTQFAILSKLKQKGPLTINALAEELVVDRTTLGRNILPLERDGLIRIAPSAADARSKELQLSTKGAARLADAAPKWIEAQKRFESAYGKGRSAELRALLRAVVTSELGATPLTGE